MRCRPGDMAVVLDAFHKCNIGKIVTVIELHDKKGDIVLPLQEPVWLVRCCVPLTWNKGKKRWRRKSGPAPDSTLQPIRGLPVDESTSLSRNKELAYELVRIVPTHEHAAFWIATKVRNLSNKVCRCSRICINN